MRSLNKVELIGNVATDPMLPPENGKGPVLFKVATNRSWKVKEEIREEAEFHRIVAWDKVGELAAKLLHKGDLVFVVGRIRTSKSKNKEGVEKEHFDIIVEDFIVLKRKEQNGQPEKPTDTPKSGE